MIYATIYLEYSKHLPESDRTEIIRKGWGTETPVTAIKGRTGTKVQKVELTETEFREWTTAKAIASNNLWGRR